MKAEAGSGERKQDMLASASDETPSANTLWPTELAENVSLCCFKPDLNCRAQLLHSLVIYADSLSLLAQRILKGYIYCYVRVWEF